MCNKLVSVWPFTASVIFAFYDVNYLWGRMDTIKKYNKTSLKLSSCRNNGSISDYLSYKIYIKKKVLEKIKYN